jgi:phenylalanyl-tRNA synthetase beta subunit
MVLFGIPDIRLFWSQDPRFTRQFEAGKISTFKPYSKNPPCYQDVSFWIEGDFHENDFCEIVRDVAGDLAEETKLVRILGVDGKLRQADRVRLALRSIALSTLKLARSRSAIASITGRWTAISRQKRQEHTQTR